MPNIHETAYPRLKASISKKDLDDPYTPNSNEIALAATYARGSKAKACILIQRKTFQRLRYFALTCEVPKRITSFISECLSMELLSGDLEKYDVSGSRQRHIAVIRNHHGVQNIDDGAKSLISSVMREAADTKDDLADIINIGIEELIRHQYELPGFTIFRAGKKPISSRQHHWLYVALAGIVADFHERIVEVNLQRVPVIERVRDSFSQF